MIDTESFFAEHFSRLTGRSPYPWQAKLFAQFVRAGDALWPEVVDLPTGAGKTSVLHIWLVALAWSILAGIRGVPRRLAWIVNRRVVVDQLTTELSEILERLDSADPDLRELLASISFSRKPLAVSTLRGQLADKGDWSKDPSTPAVVVGTVDMIGSRLLFRGYRAGAYHRPLHAGLLGVDTLIVNDEAHLSPALASLLASVRALNPARLIPGMTFRILFLSATHTASGALPRFEHEPGEDVAASKIFAAVFHASKSLSLMEVPGANEFDAAIWKLALESVAGRTAIFVEQPEKAAKLRDRLQKEGKHCALLTGTMRGFERDRLLENADFRRFLESQPGPDPVWLVCTSAGEVGINFSCERMITGLREADHLLQRFGRLNRFGSPNPGYAYVLFRNPPDKESRLREALAYLRRLDGDISCAKLWVNRPPAEACEERPALARLESRLIDMWAQTTSPDRSVPPIQAWLHGKQESEPPDTELAWRSDIRFLTDWEISTVQITEILEYYPVLAREKLTEPTMRVNKKLAEILQRIGQEAAANRRLIVIDSDGSPSVVDLAFLVTRTQKDETFLAWKLILIPDDLGSVPAGMFSPAAKESAESVLDVADPVTVSAQRPDRVRFLFTGDAVKRVASAEPVKEFPEPLSISRSDLQNFAAADFKPALVIPHPENEETFLVYFGARTLRSGPPPRDIPLTVHMESVAERARSLVGCLGFDSLKSTYEAAGKCHDTGKNRSVWQYAMGGSPENPLAKSKAPRNLRLLNGYRHELGSLIDAESNRDLAADDLLLHLIASHHKGARPFFESRQYDVTCLRQSAEQSAEAARRYARLQTQYGAWGLAWLEAIFKCADGLVSGSEGEPASA